MTEPTYNYRVTFRPLDFYFFGGELTFGNGGEVNYFAKSRPYPQQTTLLGVLRHIGFRAQETIGSSFDHEKTSNYGFIEAISPLFMRHGETDYAFGPLRAGALTGKSPVSTGSRQFRNGKWIDCYKLPDLNPKKWYERPFLAENRSSLCWENFATTNRRIGITKQRSDQDSQDGFYKQEVGYLKSGVAFACLARLNPETQLPRTTVLGVGGEKARFAVSIEPFENDRTKTFPELFPESLFASVAAPDLHCAVLLSDAYVEQEAFEELPFVVGSTEDFRYLSTPAQVTSWGRLTRHNAPTINGVIRQSIKLNLLERGSVLYADNSADLRQLLDNHRWRNIGYNHYYLLEKNTAE